MPLLDAPTAYEEWWTPQHVLEAARQALGGIDLDPASCAGANERVCATSYLTAQDSPHACDSSRRWHGRVWLNPPYTHGSIDRFVGKLISEYEHPDGGTTAAILLTKNCSDTRWFYLALSRASCVCLVRDRLWFYRMGAPGKRAARGQVIFYFGPDVALHARLRQDRRLRAGRDVNRGRRYPHAGLLFDDSSFFTGLGFWTRANPEMCLCLLATWGKPKRKSAGVRELIVSPRRDHSRKPDEAYERIEALVDSPCLEMFARHRRPGWCAWGDKAPADPRS